MYGYFKTLLTYGSDLIGQLIGQFDRKSSKYNVITANFDNLHHFRGYYDLDMNNS